MMKNVSHDSTTEEILIHVKRLEERVARMEAHMGFPDLAAEAGRDAAAPSAVSSPGSDEALEIRLGQNWFAKAGIVLLAIGIIFLLTLPYQNFPPFVPSAIGYVLVAGILGLSRRWRDSFEQISRYLLGGGLLLLYFTTLRLAYFGPAPAVTARPVELLLLCVVVAVNLLVASGTGSAYLIGLNLTLGYVTALIGGGSAFFLAATAAACIAAVALSIRSGHLSIVVYACVLAYLTHAVWSVGAPLFGAPPHPLPLPEASILFVLVYAAILSVGPLLHAGDQAESPTAIVAAFCNGLASYTLYLFLTLTAGVTGVGLLHLGASALYLGLSVLFWLRVKSRYATFVYAMLGYAALSVAIIAATNMPESLIWLCWQSVLVVTSAVWFRSRFIVVANFFIYLGVFGASLFTAGTVSAESLSFGVVALLSARILNWQKHRLELKTELMRNAYMACALLFIPYALYHTVPAGYVSLSWLVVALLYYSMSRILKNRKYRWMALLTISLTILYVVLVDLVGLEPTYRIITFLVLGSTLLGISLIYTRKRLREGTPGGNNDVNGKRERGKSSKRAKWQDSKIAE